MNRSAIAGKVARLSAAGALITALSGCLAPEESPFFRPDWNEALADADADTPVLPPVPAVRADDSNTTDATYAAQGPLQLSVEEATLLAMRNNRDLAVQRMSPVIVGAFELIERGVFDPQVFAELGYVRETASEIDRGTGAQFSVDSNEAYGLAGVRQTLPTGTDVEFSVGQNRDTSNRAPEQQDSRVGLTVTQQLLRGAGPAVNLARIRQAELDTRASLFELRGFAESLLAQVESTYWQYALAIEQIAIFEESLALAQRQLDEVEARIEVGVLAPTEAAVARAEVARREQALIDARSNLEAQRLRLLRLINIEPGGALDRPVIALSKPSLDTPPLADLPERLRLSERLRPDLAEAKLRLQQDRLETIVTRNGLLPRLEVFIGLGKTGFGDTFDGSFRAIDSETYDAIGGVRLSHYLDNDIAQGLNRAAYASREQSAAAIDNLRQLIRLDVRLAANELERARQQIQASATTRRFQEDAVRAERERFGVGASTAILVAQAQRDLLEAQIAEVEAVVAYRLALIDLYVAEGSLLERRGYVIEGTRVEID